MSQWTYRDTKEHPILRVTRLIEASNNISNDESISKDLVIRRRSKLDINTREKSKIKNIKKSLRTKGSYDWHWEKGLHKCYTFYPLLHRHLVQCVWNYTLADFVYIHAPHKKVPVALVILTSSCIKGDHLSLTNHTQKQCILFKELYKTYTWIVQRYVQCVI